MPKLPDSVKTTANKAMCDGTEALQLTLPSSTVAALDKWAIQAGLSRAEALNHLLRLSLARFTDYRPIADQD
jgi:hypothetical protein